MPSYAVTGCSRNVGKAFLKVLSDDPSTTVFALGRSPIAQELKDRSNVHEFYLDQLDLNSMRDAMQQIKEVSGGGLDCLICNATAGQVDKTTVGDGNEEDLAEKLTSALNINTIGVIQLISVMLPLLRAGAQKRVLVLTSGHGVPSYVRESKLTRQFTYGVSKAAMDMAMLRLHNQLSPEGFTIASISPSTLASEESAARNGIKDFEGFKSMIKSLPGSNGVYAPEAGVKIMLDSFGKMTPSTGGRAVGMWGTEDKWL